MKRAKKLCEVGALQMPLAPRWLFCQSTEFDRYVHYSCAKAS